MAFVPESLAAQGNRTIGVASSFSSISSLVFLPLIRR